MEHKHHGINELNDGSKLTSSWSRINDISASGAMGSHLSDLFIYFGYFLTVFEPMNE